MKLDKNTKISPFVLARYEHGYETASSLLKEIPLDKSVYSTWENGNVSYVSEGKTFVAFQKICEIFGWTIEGGRNNISNMYKWKHDDEIKIVKPTYNEWKEMRCHTEITTLDTSETDISKEEAMLNNPLKVWRGKNNLTRSEAAKLCNVDINVYSDCEDGVKKPIGYDLTKIMNTTGVSLTQLAAMFRATVGMEALKNAIEASENPDPVTLENTAISVKICDEIDHNKVIEEAIANAKNNSELNKKNEVTKDSANWPDKIFDDMKVEKSDTAIKILNEEIDKALDDRILNSTLTLREGKVLKFYYIDNRRLRDIAEAFGLSESRVQQIKSKASWKMKRRIKSAVEHINPEASKIIDEVTTKNIYPLNFIVDRCGLPAEDWIVEEFNRQMDEKVYASKDANSYIFFKDERYAIRKVFRDGVQANAELLGNVAAAELTFKDHIKKSADLIGTVAEKITEAKNEKLAKEIATVINPIYGLTSAKIDANKQDPMQKKLANQTVSYLKEENVLDGSDRPANNSKNITISKHTARCILRDLYGVLEFSEYYKILSEFTKGGLNL